MTIAVLGTGRMGAAIGVRLAGLGHKVVYGSREPANENILALLEKTGNGASVVSIAEAGSCAEMILLAVPYHALQAVLSELDDLDGKIVVDITNSLAPTEDGLLKVVSETSAAEEILQAKPCAKVVKAFNTLGFHIIANPAVAGGPVSVPLAGDEASAKSAIAELVSSLGFEAVDVGPLRHARYLEGMAALYMVPYLQGRMGDAFEFYLRSGSSPKESSGVRAAQ